jgi:hypothetical protein
MSRTPSASFSYMNAYAPQPAAHDITKPDGPIRSQIPSPPISPMERPRKEEVDSQENGVKDPLMFPRRQSGLSDSNSPLFPETAMEVDTQSTIAEHIEQKSVEVAPDRPSEAEYELILNTLGQMKFRPCVVEAYSQNPVAWRDRERRLEDYYKTCGPPKNVPPPKRKARPTAYLPIAPYPEGGVRKRIPTQKIRPQPRRTPQQKVVHAFDSLSPIPTGLPSPMKAPKTITSRDDVNYAALEDCCPPTDGITNRSLKADWKGQMLDLSNDPDRDLLHEAEVHLASTLRLTCATYLCSKRRIFLEKRKSFLAGQDFRKTNAQQACKIDVNKASKLWTAFDKAGWFDAKHFVKYRGY